MPLVTRSRKSFMISPIISYPHDLMHVIHIIWNRVDAGNILIEYLLIYVTRDRHYILKIQVHGIKYLEFCKVIMKKRRHLFLFQTLHNLIYWSCKQHISTLRNFFKTLWVLHNYLLTLSQASSHVVIALQKPSLLHNGSRIISFFGCPFHIKKDQHSNLRKIKI